ncbi:hypothetical protein ROSALIND_49 [Paenibacillus phage Rosalind]|uniref:Uncharacterized protein n=4 Tax=Vegasvirus vegas TaxID=2034999 RepID=A0A0K2CZ72_9CAUD|nr:hypothetical protein VEGAS_60 [Paenibacillus phage Vegas]ALA12788.1 hypothetical protein HAYLEY_58 [Paenibacillus phage Hayley]ALA12875.1 hypothetical protein VADIM_60 [Paenibacillus phage Vadim]ALA12961.1 hypothetical protein DIANE_60 [Paenibacillus phage Diane]UYE92075.1 hypothetical protein LUNBUN_51 [Paenibacillus phage LunBun]UYE92157.1 hypothetical protein BARRYFOSTERBENICIO_51 [Paenibacillus phage BarryFoster_Benicio]UYL91521.1 hypothetical protein ABATENZ_51 [Paenibacillus phage AB
MEIEAYKTTVKGVRRLLKVWLIRLGSLTDVVLYDTKETALSALAGMLSHDSASKVKGIYEVNLELKTIEEYALGLENMKLTLKKKG